MCGLAGIANAHGSADAGSLAAALALGLAHRGPDGEGFWACGPAGEGLCTREALPDSAEVVLAHRRLSIVDLEGGSQPMTNEDGTVWLTYNGEIYNQTELRRELESRGHSFKTSCDTEVIVHGWEEWQEDVFGRLNGIFTVALYDRRTREVVLARDPVGVKPLYMGTRDGLTWWSSELAPAIAAGLSSESVSADALKLFFQFRFIPSPYTIYESAWKVPPGHLVRFDSSRAIAGPPAFRPFGSRIRSALSPRGRGEWREAIIDELQDSIERQLMADVPVGSLLSGGVDSSLVTTTMADRLSYRPMTFGIGFTSRGDRSEAVAARLAAEELGVPHRSMELSDEEYLAEWPRSFRQVGEPLANGGGHLIYLLCRLASADHKVVLTGQGADEPLGGYSRHVVERLYGLGRLAPHLFPKLTRPVLGADASERIGRALAQPERLDRYVEIFSGMAPEEVDRLVPSDGAPARELARAAIERWLDPDPDADPVNELLRIDVRMSLADDLLVVADHHAMRASVELRVPFLDLQFLELVERMPSRYKVSRLGERKWLYRQGAAARLPTSLRRRVCGPIARLGRKEGFTAPLVAWFGGGEGNGAGVGKDWVEALGSVPEVSLPAARDLTARPDDHGQARRSSSLYALAQWATPARLGSAARGRSSRRDGRPR